LGQSLRQAGIEDRIMHKAKRNKPLTRWQKTMNRAISPIRTAVERCFGTLKRSYGWRRVRYIGLARNATHLDFLAAAMNLRRALVLRVA
jgi:IS5 family transposase